MKLHDRNLVSRIYLLGVGLGTVGYDDFYHSTCVVVGPDQSEVRHLSFEGCFEQHRLRSLQQVASVFVFTPTTFPPDRDGAAGG